MRETTGTPLFRHQKALQNKKNSNPQYNIFDIYKKHLYVYIDAWRKWKGERPPVDPYFDTKKRANQVIMTRLLDKQAGTTFCVATYHMPCQFRLPEVMVSHTVRVSSHGVTYGTCVKSWCHIRFVCQVMVSHTVRVSSHGVTYGSCVYFLCQDLI